jgi:hypothetical protein
MGVAIHETTHAINPNPILKRRWITEAWAVYGEYNILSMYYGNDYPDINQETSDTYIYNGNNYYNWEDYVANDYHDTSPDNDEIQSSSGYYIGAWMLSMLRDDYVLPWQNLYSIIDNNPETLNKALELGGGGHSSIFTDTHVIDLFERAIGVEMEPVFRYDGPEGPGWGVRNWTDLNWYADLTPVLEVSNLDPDAGETITLDATIYNNGDVSLENVVVRFYAPVCVPIDEHQLLLSTPLVGGISGLMSSPDLIYEGSVSVDAQSFTEVSINYTGGYQGHRCMSVKVDEDNLKVESDEENNQAFELVNFHPPCGDVNNDTIIEVSDLVFLINYLYRNGPEPICDPITCCGDVNLDGIIEVSDLVFLINYLYRNGPAPCSGVISSGLKAVPQDYAGAMKLLRDAQDLSTPAAG